MKIHKKRPIKKVLLIALIICFFGSVVVFGVNAYVVGAAKDKIISADECTKLENVDCIVVLGCYVYKGMPSDMLRDRLLQGIGLYETDAASKIIMSGDHGRDSYDEVNIMKQFAVDRGVPSEDVFMDHAGFSTYESLYRARDVFCAKKIIIVTQRYHLYRALYIAESLGLEAYGVAADPREYTGQTYRDLREILARNKDFWTSLFQPEPTFLGEAIPVNGNGDLTNDS